MVQAQLNVIAAESPANIEETVADKGYHAAEQLADVNETLGIRTYIPEPKRNHALEVERPYGGGASSSERQSSACEG